MSRVQDGIIKKKILFSFFSSSLSFYLFFVLLVTHLLWIKKLNREMYAILMPHDEENHFERVQFWSKMARIVFFKGKDMSQIELSWG